MSKLDKLTRSQRQAVTAELTASERRMASIKTIESTAGERAACPHCCPKGTVKNRMADGLQRYSRVCGRSFNALTGTPLARLRMKGKWLDQTAALRDGLSLTEASRRLGVSRPTAFRWRHRFLATPKTVQARVLVGIAESDETYFLRSSKGQRKDLGRNPRHRGGKATKRGLSKEQVPVLVARDRAGSTADFVLEADDHAHVAAALKPLLPRDTILCTDGSSVLTAAAREMGVTHRPVNLSSGIRIVAGVYHVQNVNAYDSRLKTWMRRFNGVATK
ncbi:transposase [Sulfurimicrobium lacus]|uniref:Transposase n=1 Tax=Sulfurimicrobium lacus TaxID=2715678 RepID=A0A6F8VDU4_9PROT|nr:transposase [Sulfurimicrobium lacus]